VGAYSVVASVSEEEVWEVGGIARAFGARFDLDDLVVVGIALTLALTGISSLLTPLGNIAVSAAVVLA
jgi:hypothetical protein